MLELREDPVYLAQRITCSIAEDIGLTDTSAFAVVVNTLHVCHFIGMPERTVHLTGAVIYPSMTPKSNGSYIAYEHMKKGALYSMTESVLLVIRGAPTRLMKDLGYDKGYRLTHNEGDKVAVDMQCLPDSLVGTEYYTPTKEGRKDCLRERLIRFKVLRQGHQ